MDYRLFDQLTADAERKAYESGATIVRQGARADSFFVLLSGSVNVFQSANDGTSMPVASLTAPSFFGEMELLEGGRRTATVRVSEDGPVEVLVIARDAYVALIEASDMIADEIAALIQTRRGRGSLARALIDFPVGRLDEVYSGARHLTFEQGDKLIRQGDPAEHFYILTQGRVEVLHRRQDGETYLINFHEPGEYFGEIGILQNRPRSATVRAADERVEVLQFSRDDFVALLDESPATESAIAEEMARRLLISLGK